MADVVRDAVTGCWLYTGYQLPTSGYGQMGSFVDGGWKLLLAHRVSYEVFCGPIPAGMLVLHRCDVRPCVNPAHLFLGTYADNVRDALSKGRFSCGERHYRSKLTAENVSRIRLLASQGETYAELGRIFGISKGTARSIAHGKTWRTGPQSSEITPPLPRKPGRKPRVGYS